MTHLIHKQNVISHNVWMWFTISTKKSLFGLQSMPLSLNGTILLLTHSKGCVNCPMWSYTLCSLWLVMLSINVIYLHCLQVPYWGLSWGYQTPTNFLNAGDENMNKRWKPLTFWKGSYYPIRHMFIIWQDILSKCTNL